MKKPYVLIVEDEAAQLRRLVRVLKEHYDVLQASTGQEALMLYKTHHKDISVMVLDIRLPDMTAFELLNSFEKYYFPGVPATIIQTAFDDNNWIQTMLGDHRAFSYIIKPYEDSDILQAVSLAMSSNTLISKKSQIEERTTVMLGISRLRDILYQQVPLMSPEESKKWMPEILSLYKLYGEISPETGMPRGDKDDFKLKNSLKDILIMAASLLDTEIIMPDHFKIGIIGDQEQEIANLIMMTKHQSGEGLVKNPKYQVENLTIHQVEEARQMDIVLVDLDAKVATPEDLSSYCHKITRLTQNKAPYLIVFTAKNNPEYLEEYTRLGATFGIFKDDVFADKLFSIIYRFVNRRFELEVLQNILNAQH
jgi:CheY-like chemotaxis protein